MAKSRAEVVLQNLESIEEWASQGMCEKDIACRLGISDRTLRNYKQEYSSVFSALETGKTKVHSDVEVALLKRALGYEIEEEQAVKVKEIYYDGEGRKCEKEHVEVVKVLRKYPPDVAAAKFWLNNRKKEYWKDNPHKVKNDRELLELRKKELEAKEW